MNNELKARLITALELASDNASELSNMSLPNNDSARYQRLIQTYQDEIAECQALIQELSNVI